MKRTFSGATAALALVVQAFAGGVASADPQAGTHVDTVAASAGPTVVSVSGTATFVDIPVTVGTDPTGDAAVSNVGADVTTLSVSRPSPVSGNLVFSMGVADAGATNGTPPIGYYWPVAVGDTDDGYYLEGRNVSLAFPTAAAPTFKLMQDTPDGFLDVATLSGTMAGGKVTITLPLSRISAVGGDVINQGSSGGGLGTALTAPGALRFNGNLAGDGAFLDEGYTVPFAEVKLGIAEAGTPEPLVPLTTSGTVNATNGTFSGFLPKPASAGSYIVVAKACYGPSNCGTATSTLTI